LLRILNKHHVCLRDLPFELSAVRRKKLRAFRD
jgi:hypothetical protein